MIEEETMEFKPEEQPEPQQQPPEQQYTNLNDMKVGYVVSLTDKGEFFFDVFGQQKGLLEVLGLHHHATKRIESLYNNTQMTEDALLRQVGTAIGLLHEKVDVIRQAVAPKKPDNDLG